MKSILKDRDGFMWFGTFNGLNRYDGSNFKLFRSGENSALGDNIIECLAEDQQGNIWVGTFSGGLHRFDRNTETFTGFQHYPKLTSSISGNRIKYKWLIIKHLDQKFTYAQMGSIELNRKCPL